MIYNLFRFQSRWLNIFEDLISEANPYSGFKRCSGKKMVVMEAKKHLQVHLQKE